LPIRRRPQARSRAAIRRILAMTLWRMLWLLGAASAAMAAEPPAAACAKPVYLTIDTGHMGVAELFAEVLKRQAVRATFFLANERTRTGGSSLDDNWAPWWRARAAEGHAFGSHTWDHDVWLADQGDGFGVRPTMGPEAGKPGHVDAAAYCAEIDKPAQRFRAMTGQAMLPLFRAPGGKTSPALLAAARQCGWTHVPWSAAGFLGDELPSERFPNAELLARALRDIRPGDILLAHLGIWSRKDAWAPANLEPLIRGLKQRGFCFLTLREHPAYREIAAIGR
jgi:peptidoglycan/xylan/chitin deacetylase (PgdA/CDA1 family)